MSVTMFPAAKHEAHRRELFPITQEGRAVGLNALRRRRVPTGEKRSGVSGMRRKHRTAGGLEKIFRLLVGGTLGLTVGWLAVWLVWRCRAAPKRV